MMLFQLVVSLFAVHTLAVSPPVCPGDLELQECGSACPLKCGNPASEGCITVCQPNVCDCPPGLWRTADDRCVEHEQCPEVQPEACPGDLELKECGTACEARCGEPTPEFCTKQCIPNVCQCPEGQFRTADDRCVEESMCDALRPTCPGDTLFTECGSVCENRCGQPKPRVCTKQCAQDVCRCPPGLFRTDDDRCVAESQCPAPETCPGQTVLQECGTPCESICGEAQPKWCKALDIVMEKYPQQICTKNVCQCPPGTHRTSDDECVEECPLDTSAYVHFSDFQEACRDASGRQCKEMGCGRAKKGEACPVPNSPVDVRCSLLSAETGDCAMVGCQIHTKRSGRKVCKGTSTLSTEAA